MIIFVYLLLVLIVIHFICCLNYEIKQHELSQHRQEIRHEIIKLRLERLDKEEKEYYMDGETLRQNTIEGIDKALSKPLVILELGQDNVRLLKAHRAFWMNATQDELQKLLDVWRNN